jgi:hypothetical protein
MEHTIISKKKIQTTTMHPTPDHTQTDCRILINGEVAIHDVYYNEFGDITAITVDPVYPANKDIISFEREAWKYLSAMYKPALTEKDLCHLTETDGVLKWTT